MSHRHILVQQTLPKINKGINHLHGQEIWGRSFQIVNSTMRTEKGVEFGQRRKSHYTLEEHRDTPVIIGET